MAKTGYFVMDSMEQTFKYGVTVYQVWSWVLQAESGSANFLQYETSSKAKANAVCEYLILKVEQDDLDGYRSEDIKGTIKPSSIKVS
jgi:hypothetical protein